MVWNVLKAVKLTVDDEQLEIAIKITSLYEIKIKTAPL